MRFCRKNFRVTEHITAQFRAEIYNIFNFVNYGNGSPYQARNTQLALKLLW